MKKTKKTTKKVIKNIVQSKKKATKKVVSKKKKKRIVVCMEDIYKVLNKVQLTRKEETFSVDNDTVDVVENIIRDLKLVYKLNRMKTQAVFNVKPGEEMDNYDIIDVEYLDDEICPDNEIDFGHM
jgi:IS30 family transposase